MTEMTADLFVSLDGFAGGDFGQYFGYGGPEIDEWIQAELDKPRLVVMGRVTYESLATFSSDTSDPGSQRLTAVPKLVVSSTLSQPLEWANTRLVAGDAIEMLPAVKDDSDVPLRTMGSISLVRNLVGAGLVDRLRLMVFPVDLREQRARTHLRRGKAGALRTRADQSPRRAGHPARVQDDQLARWARCCSCSHSPSPASSCGQGQ
jgi:dihydrofolate reductase